MQSERVKDNPLSPAEQEALAFIASGYTRREIAEMMHLSKASSVGSIACRAAVKLGAANIYHAIYIATKNGWLG